MRIKQAKRRLFRKILDVSSSTVQIDGRAVLATQIVWCAVQYTTAKTIRAKNISVTVYLGKYRSTVGIHFQPVSIKLKNPMTSKLLAGWSARQRDYDVNCALSQVGRGYALESISLP